MTDTIGTDIKEVPDLMAFCPVTERFALLGSLGVLGGGNVVDNCLDLFGIKHAVTSDGYQIVDGNGSCDLMAENSVKRDHPHTGSRTGNFVCIKDFLSYGLSHNLFYLLIFFDELNIKSIPSFY